MSAGFYTPPPCPATLAVKGLMKMMTLPLYVGLNNKRRGGGGGGSKGQRERGNAGFIIHGQVKGHKTPV